VVLLLKMLFLILTNSGSQSFEVGGANISGTFISSRRSIIIGDGATLNNSRFYTTATIIANVQDVRFPLNTAVNVPITEPSILTIFAIGLIIRHFNKRD
jgi:hypothetical protein